MVRPMGTLPPDTGCHPLYTVASGCCGDARAPLPYDVLIEPKLFCLACALNGLVQTEGSDGYGKPRLYLSDVHGALLFQFNDKNIDRFYRR